MAENKKLNKRQIQLIEKAIRYMISNLQYERHQAVQHGCKGGSYDEEIEEYKRLKQLFPWEFTEATEM